MSPGLSPHARALWGCVSLFAVLAVLGVTVSNTFHLSTLTNALVYAIAALGLYLLFGLAGQISFGQAAFFGLGAYVAGGLVQRTTIEPLLAVVAAVVVAAVIGWCVARPLLRLSGHALAMASLAFGVIMYILFAQSRSLTGGMDPGMSIRAFSLFGWPIGTVKGMYWVSAVALLLATWLVVNLVHSRYGRALVAIKSSEIASEGAAIATSRIKTMAFSTAAGLAGLAGALFAFSLRSFNASSFGFDLSIELVIVVIVGSLRSVWGALFGALLVTLLPLMLGAFNDYKLLGYGVAMALIMMLMPQGLFDGILAAVRRPGYKESP